MKTKTHGGKRAGAGQKLKYGEPTEQIYFRVPVSKKEKVIRMVKPFLKSLEIKK